MNEKYTECLIIGHLSLGDLFIINGIVRYYSSKFIKTYLLCRNENLISIQNIFSDNNSIIPISIDQHEHTIQTDHYIFDLYKNAYIIKLGVHNFNWYYKKSHYNIQNLPYFFFKTFYDQYDLPYQLRYDYEKINRNFLSEDNFYKNNIYNTKYIFLHDLDNTLKINNINNLPIFHPNFNNNNISHNILDYCKIIENAYEIHLTFSSFFNLCMFLDLSKVSKKYIYTNIVNIKDFHINMKDWILIML